MTERSSLHTCHGFICANTRDNKRLNAIEKRYNLVIINFSLENNLGGFGSSILSNIVRLF